MARGNAPSAQEPQARQLMTGAQALVRALEKVGVTDIFGMPGGAIPPFYDPLLASSKIRHVLVRHEQGAGHAAEGYAMVTGRPGVDRRHIAQVLLEGAAVPSGARRTVEVFSTTGAPVTDFEALFAATRADEPGVLDGVLDTNNVPLAEEPARVRDDIARLGRRGT